MNEEVKEKTKVDGRTTEGKVQAKLESRLKKIEETLVDHEKRITACSVQR